MDTEITRAVEESNKLLRDGMKARLIVKMGELIKPEVDNLLEEVAEEMLKGLKQNLTCFYSLFDDQHVFHLSIKDKEKREV